MKHYFSTFDNIVLTHSDMEYGDGGRKVRVYFERPGKDTGSTEFDFAEGDIPSFEFRKSYGFSQSELLRLQRYLRNNSFLIWEYAQNGGGQKCLAS
ncbi:MAG: hypothetical protein LBU70_10175 [Chitinispirillales bacterium]|jgi:hypothetical protein|nr:hypothetical protein [Chitinispirillales bacterium]